MGVNGKIPGGRHSQRQPPPVKAALRQIWGGRRWTGVVGDTQVGGAIGEHPGYRAGRGGEAVHGVFGIGAPQHGEKLKCAGAVQREQAVLQCDAKTLIHKAGRLGGLDRLHHVFHIPHQGNRTVVEIRSGRGKLDGTGVAFNQRDAQLALQF